MRDLLRRRDEETVMIDLALGHSEWLFLKEQEG